MSTLSIIIIVVLLIIIAFLLKLVYTLANRLKQAYDGLALLKETFDKED